MAVASLPLRQRAEQLAATLPPLLVAAERVASTVIQGVHGRRRVGQGETFWQFRGYHFGDQPQSIDWRQSAKSDRVYVRQMEWEAAQSVWVWCDTSASMNWRSSPDHPDQRERAELLALALTALIAGAAAATVMVATRASLAVHRETIELLHLIGAQDGFVARAFARRALGMGLRGGLIGLGLAGVAAMRRRRSRQG